MATKDRTETQMQATLTSDERIMPPAEVPVPAGADAGASDIQGLIDNATASRLYGWAWDRAHPGDRVKVELRLSGQVVATTIADIARPDLAKHGVGDGVHAFEFPLLRKWFNQLKQLSVVAYGRDGSETLLAVHTRSQDEMLVPAETTARLQSISETLMTEHRALRQEIEATRKRAAELPEASAVEAIATAGQELQRRIDGLEIWITRLDARLAESAQPQSPPETGRLDTWQAVLIAMLVAVLSIAATVVALRRFG